MDAENLAFLEGLYAEYTRDPASVPTSWRAYFDSLGAPAGAVKVGPSFTSPSIFNPPAPANGAAHDAAALQEKVDRLIRVFRVRGHRLAQVDPLGRPVPEMPELDPVYFGITEADLDKSVVTTNIAHPGLDTPRKVIDHLRETYCRSIGAQFMHIDDVEVTGWLARRMEGSRNRLELTRDEQRRIFRRLNDAVTFEEFLQTKYIGSKSFSLEGGESLIPLLDMAIEKVTDEGIEEIVLAMAHRGRLNVLANILGKTPREIFAEFEDFETENPHGDVKYHMGYNNDWTTQSGKTAHLALCFNPSHLEFINPIALGRVRAKQDRLGDNARERGLAIIIHGDAAVIGQGVVQETYNLSQLGGYRVGGALHIVLNNQIGFTTLPEESRSTVYCTDVAKMLQIPILHVNGEDPEAVAQCVRLALDFRREFKRDVVIDMYCYRLRGHNEGDEPSYTQPLMYKHIRARKEVKDSYLEHLLSQGGITEAEAREIEAHPKAFYNDELLAAKRQSRIFRQKHHRDGAWRGFVGGPEENAEPVQTGVPGAELRKHLAALATPPAGFTVHPKLARFIETRQEMARGEKPLDWGAAEALAWASLAAQGVSIRLSGQDSERGTFTHRHGVLHDHENGKRHNIFDAVAPGRVQLVNSPLSEVGVLGFEYGYSLDHPEALTMWEAQFGDFVNVAQVIIDQFIASAEEKWRRLSGLVMLLPHGMEGQGPEHSSARLERFLNLAAGDNLQVAYPSTPAQYFHLLRRQVLRKWKKPLIVMTPKSLLRNPACVSTLAEFEGGFQRFIPDSVAKKPARILLCTGKVYYDLLAARDEAARKDVAIIRVEQLYPLKDAELRELLARYPEKTPVYWVQEENENMGACTHMRWHFDRAFAGKRRIEPIARAISASPATGSPRRHKWEQADLIKRALG